MASPVPREGNAGGGDGNAGGSERGFHLLDAVSCPGFRFRPTDEELLSCYLKKKVSAENEKCVQLIAEVEFCNYEPWDLPCRAILQTNDPEWYFCAPRSKKYPKGFQTRRATRAGYWKATGKERPEKSGSEVLGTKRTLCVLPRPWSKRGKEQNGFVMNFPRRGASSMFLGHR